MDRLQSQTQTRIDHLEILKRYRGWELIPRPSCVQYWNDQYKQSLFFDDLYLETGTPTERYKMRLPRSWREFEFQVKRSGIILEEVKMEPEEKSCNECGEQWIDTGDDQCPFCGSSNIEPVDDEEDTNDDPDPLAA